MALFMIAQSWKPSKRPTTDEWINNMWYTHTVEYYSAIRRNDELIGATNTDKL